MLRITTRPDDAQIFVNGQRKGNSSSQEGQTFAVRLPQGEYTVEARKSDGKDYYGKKSVFVPTTACKPSASRWPQRWRFIGRCRWAIQRR